MNQLVFLACSTWCGREAAVPSHFWAHLGSDAGCLICCLFPSASALQASGSPSEGRGKLLALEQWSCRETFWGSKSPANALGVGLQQWTESGNEQGDPGPPAPGGWCDCCPPLTQPADFIFPCGWSELHVWNAALSWEIHSEVSLADWSLRNTRLPSEEQERLWVLSSGGTCLPDPFCASAVAVNDSCVDVSLGWGVWLLEQG